MAYKVNESKCTNCGSCDSACPAGAISEKDGKRSIDANTCLDCGVCAGECPVQAIAEA